MPGKVIKYEAVNLADIETSSDEDDYGRLFRGTDRKRVKFQTSRKKDGCCRGAACLRGMCVLMSVTLSFVILASAAFYFQEYPLLKIFKGGKNSSSDQEQNNAVLSNIINSTQVGLGEQGKPAALAGETEGSTGEQTADSTPIKISERSSENADTMPRNSSSSFINPSGSSSSVIV